MKIKTRGFFITRVVKEISENAKGEIVEKVVKKTLPCRVNAAVPFDHKMCK